MPGDSIFVEYHILQNFAPSLLNRDDTGAHKDASFGGVRRARISSQCLKRAMREYWRSNGAILDGERALRTKRILDALKQRLVGQGRDSAGARARAQMALGALKLQAGDDGKSQYLLFLGADELERMAGVIHDHWDGLEPEAPAEGDGAKSSKGRKRAAKEALPPEVVREMREALRDTRSLEVRLFGRMLADAPEFNTDATLQVAHALGTSALDREFDYFTAVDDLQPDETTGADMIGQVEFASSCFYRYAVLDLRALHEVLGRDQEVTERSLRLLSDAMIHAAPRGKQNTFAAHQKPSHIGIHVGTQPRSMANAFERPIRVSGVGLSLSGKSAEQLMMHRERLDASYGVVGSYRFHDLSDAGLKGGEKDAAGVVEAAVELALAQLA